MKYPSMKLVSRLWTVTRFVREAITRLCNCKYITTGLVELFARKLTECKDLTCENSWNLVGIRGIAHRAKIIKAVLRKFLRPLIQGKMKAWTERNQCNPIVHNKPLHSRKVLKLQ